MLADLQFDGGDLGTDTAQDSAGCGRPVTRFRKSGFLPGKIVVPKEYGRVMPFQCNSGDRSRLLQFSYHPVVPLNQVVDLT